MNRRELIFGGAALLGGAAIGRPAAAAIARAFDQDLWPPVDSRDAFVAWMKDNRGEDPEFLGQRWDRCLQLISHNDVWDRADKRAFLMTPREEFVTAENLSRAYEWHYLNIGFGVTVTGPHTVARMTNALAVKPGDKVLEIGTGSGYQSAYLSYLTDRLWSIEIIPALAKRTRGVYDSLIARGYKEYAAIQTKTADGDHGWPEAARSTRSSSPAASTIPAAAAAAAQARRRDGHSGGAARRAARAQGGQSGHRRWLQRVALRHLQRRDHPVRAVHRRPPELRRRSGAYHRLADQGADPRRHRHRQRPPERHAQRRLERRRAAEPGAERAERSEKDERRRRHGDDGRRQRDEKGDQGRQRRAGREAERRGGRGEQGVGAAPLAEPELVARVGAQRVRRHELLGDLARESRRKAAPLVDRGQLAGLDLGEFSSARRSRSRSAASELACEPTETYSPAAIAIAPAAQPAAAAVKIAARPAPDAATPTIRLAVEMMPSLAPSTAARSHAARRT